MSKRAISSSKRSWLLDEMEWWRDAGILTAGQSQEILDQYESVTEAAESHSSRAVNALMGAAALLVGAGVLLLISFNWEGLHVAAKLVLIFGTILGTYYGAFRLRQREMIGLSNVLFFLGAFFYGCGIMLIGQMFHLSGHPMDAVWWWALGTLPIAVCLESLLLHALVVGLLAIWCGGEILGFGNLGLNFFFRWRWVPNGAYTYRRQLASVLWLYVPLLTWWLSLQGFAWEGIWNWHHNPLFFIGGVGGLLLIAAEAHASGSKMAIPYRMYGVLMVGSMLIPMSFKEVHRRGSYHAADPSLGALLQPIAIVSLTVVALAVMARLHGQWKTRQELSGALKDTIKRQYVPVGITLLMAFFSMWYSLVPEPITPTILANIAMLIFGVWLMLVGLREDRGRPFSAGVLYFLGWTTMRYVDLFGDIGGMLGGAGLFFACGAFLFGMAYFWKHRKKKEVLA
ncbi:MAG: hypothetical protein FD138_1803 [Planctomycetota bacterium]|nr:MAG: hypothetical protein FD138_1803 [Planctomycetota bacterium]